MTYPAYFHPFAFLDGLPLAIVRFADIGYKDGSTKAMCAALITRRGNTKKRGIMILLRS